MKIAVIANSAWYLHNFRSNLMRSLIAAGHQPVAISPVDDYAERLTQQGFVHRPLALAPSGTNPLAELLTVLRLRRILAEERVDVALTFTSKPNIYTGLVGRGLRFRHVPNVSGLGRVFIRRSLLTPLVRGMYRLAFRRAQKVIFQNEDDREVFIGSHIVDREVTLRVYGSGVDLERFRPLGDSGPGDAVRFLLVARVLWDKGVGEFVAAARALRREYPRLIFEMLGAATSDNPAAVPKETIQSWQEEGLIAHTDHVDDVRPYLARADCVVLPSYREGLPRTLLEAAAMGKPLIATDVPGCRDAIKEGVNGFLCQPANAESLEAVMRRFLSLSDAQRLAMGSEGRKLVERRFDEKAVIATYLDLVNRPGAR